MSGFRQAGADVPEQVRHRLPSAARGLSAPVGTVKGITMLRKLAFVVGSASLVAASVAHALGLGDIRPGSGLNQPLNAEIQLVALRGVAPEEIRATIASADEFDRAGIERVYALNDLKLVVQGTADGEAVIKLRTNDAVREPFLNFIVELNWPNGRLLREYTLLLDPPVFADEAPVVTARPRVQTPATTTGTVTSAPAPARQPSETAAPAAPVGNTMAGADSYGPINANDTLWSIASRVRPNDSVTVQQTLVAILKANPQAFINNNPNQMRQGETLRIPSADDIAAVPHRRALAEFVGAGAVVETARRSGSADGTSAGSGRLTLAAPPENFSTGKGGASREAAEVLNQENEALRGELGKLVDKTQKLEKLVQLKDQQLAAVTGKAPDSTVPVEEPAPSTLTETPSAETGAVDTTDTSTMPDLATTEPAVSQPVVEEPPVEKPKKKPTTPAKPVEEPSFLEDFLGENWLIYLLGLAGVIVGGLGFLFWKRRQVAEENFHESLLPLEPDDDDSMRIEDDLNLPEVGEDFLAPPPVSASSENVTTPAEAVADPLGESDIYIAYGKYEQAEQLLLRALQDDPHRHELRVKLLECYAEMQEQSKFRDQVAMFQDAIDADPQLAKQVAKLQQRAWPSDHFSTKTAPTPIPSADDIFGSVGVGKTAAAPAPLEETSWAPTRKESVASDFDNEGEFNLDLDADLANLGKAETAAPAAELDLGVDDSEFSFDLDEPANLSPKAQADWQPEQEPTPSRASAADDSFNLDDMDSDLPSGDELGMGDIDEIATKLDLARAYIEMHEVDGAKEILQEVISEGNAQQKQEAQALLAKL